MQLDKIPLDNYNRQRPESSHLLPCWAPVKSMYIGLRGKVMTCCYNKIYLLGEYPSQTLHDIWFSNQRKSLLTTLQKNDFSLGCQGCHELITAGNFGGLPAKNFDHLPKSSSGYPTKIDFELSNECNLECVMCRGEFSSAIRKNREKLPPIPTPYDQNFVTQLEEFIPHLNNCHFLGGEPFLIPVYLDIWELIHRIKPEVKLSIQTNGTILTDRIKKILESMSFDISVSIDSVEPENYERIRKNGRFSMVINNIRYLRDYCRRKNTQFSIASCPMTVNWHELPEIIKFGNELDAEVFFTTVNYPKELALESLSSDELESIKTRLSSNHYAQKTPVEKNNYNNIQHVINHINYWIDNNKKNPSLKVSTMEEYLKGLELYILENHQGSDTEDLMANIGPKLHYLLSVAKEHNNYDQAMEKILEVNYKTILETVPNIEKEHLLHLFQAYIIPIA